MALPRRLFKRDVCIACAVIGWVVAVAAGILLVSLGMGLVTGQPEPWRPGFGGMPFLPVALVLMLPALLGRAALSHDMGWGVFALVGAVVGVPAYLAFHEFYRPPVWRPVDGQWSGVAVFLGTGAVAGAVWWGTEQALRPRRSSGS